MRSFYRIFSIVCLAASLSACGTKPAPSYESHTETEFAHGLMSVVESQMNMNSYGMKIDDTVSAKEYHWDMTYFREYKKKKAFDVTKAQDYLKEYSAKLHAYLNTYGKPFNCVSDKTGESTVRQLRDEVRQSLEAKARLVDQTIGHLDSFGQ